MRTVMRPRYYCDHCRKGNGSPSAMKRHESRCTANPRRVCGMCALMARNGGPAPAPPRDQLLRVLAADGFAAMCAAANNCPACILSALRTMNDFDPEYGPCVSGPKDGRQEWSYEQAKEEWWIDFNSSYGYQENY